MRASLNYINKPDFLRAYFKTRKETLVISYIYSGFSATSLIPYNPNRVLEKLYITL
jgi:hypothetical protein